MVRLAGALALFAVITGALGAIMTVRYPQEGWADIGKSLLTLSVSLIIGGVVTTILKVADRSRDDRSTWSQLLRSVVEVDQSLTVARQLILAHRTARTYSEQHAKIVDAGLVVRRVWGDPLVANDRESLRLRVCLEQMKAFVDGLGLEYEKDYLAIARQQRVDEEYLKIRVGELGKAYPQVDSPEDPVYTPTRAWHLLTTSDERFENFRRLIGADYNETEFVQAFLELKPMLEKRAGIQQREDPPQPSSR